MFPFIRIKVQTALVSKHNDTNIITVKKITDEVVYRTLPEEAMFNEGKRERTQASEISISDVKHMEVYEGRR